MEYVYFRAENVAVSSSMVKELHSFGLDISPYVPKEIIEVMK
jgi:pantetheine-phosphate adenylyltransferase